MVIDQPTAAEMAREVWACFDELNLHRKYLFLEWLYSHNSQMRHSRNFRNSLTTWLESLQYDCAVWEYTLLLKEITWWKGLDEVSFTEMMIDHFSRGLL